ncbi:MAG: polysaccharide biosynthesis protein [Clostridia bacterium]|nr:polysaccharide biosynthesis protein [Clostridia bacterium]
MNKNKNAAPKSAVNMFFSGVVVLTIANILVKSVGLISKIALNTVVGSEGAGYYSSAYEIYAFLYVIATSGLPVAISIMVSKCRAQGKVKEARKIFNVAMVLFMIIGGFFASMMALFSDEIANFISAPNTSICIVAISPTILFVCLSSCMRGFFQGYQLMKPTGISQFIEAICKVGIGVGFALWAKSQNYDDFTVAAFTILGITIGVFLGMVFLYIRKLFFNDTEYYEPEKILSNETNKPTKTILKDLALIAIPITLSSAVLSLTTIIDTLMVQTRLLDTGLAEDLVRVYYGDYTTLVISMFNLPTILIYPIANALVPLISSTIATRDYERSANMRSFSLRVINMIAVPCSIGLGVFSYPILDLLMFTKDSVERSAPWLSVAAVSVIFLGLIAATNAFLNTAGKQRLPIISMLVGATVKLVGNYFLLDAFGIYGAPLSTVLCYLSAATLNIFFTVKYVGKLPNVNKIFLQPLFCAVVSIGLSAIIYMLISSIIPAKIATIICILTSALGYVFMIIRTKTVTKEELLLLPHSEKPVKILQKLRFFSSKC